MLKDDNHSISRVHDLFGALLGLFALVILVTIPWQIDTTGPDPFYKGPLIFPLIVLFIMVIGSLPSIWHMVRPEVNASWYLDGEGIPFKTMAVAGLLALYPASLNYMGLEISTFLFLFFALRVVKHDSVLKLTIIPTVITAVLFFMFKGFLDIWFPTPLLFELFME
jgi:hypothetical protein